MIATSKLNRFIILPNGVDEKKFRLFFIKLSINCSCSTFLAKLPANCPLILDTRADKMQKPDSIA